LLNFFFVKAVEMIENILNEFKVILSESDWMDEESKLNALAKASSIDTKIGYPEWIKNDTYLNELYDDVIEDLNSSKNIFIVAEKI
jgi:membrane metallo-endopeptidase-like protein 1